MPLAYVSSESVISAHFRFGACRLEVDLLIFVRRKPTALILQRPKIFSRSVEFQEIASGKLRHELDDVARIKRDIIASLEAIGLSSQPIPGQEMIDLIYRQWNPSRNIDLQNFGGRCMG